MTRVYKNFRDLLISFHKTKNREISRQTNFIFLIFLKLSTLKNSLFIKIYKHQVLSYIWKIQNILGFLVKNNLLFYDSLVIPDRYLILDDIALKCLLA